MPIELKRRDTYLHWFPLEDADDLRRVLRMRSSAWLCREFWYWLVEKCELSRPSIGENLGNSTITDFLNFHIFLRDSSIEDCCGNWRDLRNYFSERVNIPHSRSIDHKSCRIFLNSFASAVGNRTLASLHRNLEPSFGIGCSSQSLPWRTHSKSLRKEGWTLSNSKGAERMCLLRCEKEFKEYQHENERRGSWTFRLRMTDLPEPSWSGTINIPTLGEKCSGNEQGPCHNCKLWRESYILAFWVLGRGQLWGTTTFSH